MSKQLRHLWSLAAGAASWSVVDGRWWAFLIVFAAGVTVGACSLTLWRLLRRVGRFTFALERKVTEPPLTDDEAYLAGVERGIRSARRSAGHEDGRLAELDRLNGREFA